MQLNKIHSKKAALELSIGTVVVIVIGMSMLILGLVLVRKIFVGSTYNIDILNEKVEGQINKLFEEDDARRVVFYLPNNEVKVKLGETFGVAFGIRNSASGESSSSDFTYNLRAAEIETGCSGLTLEQAQDYISLGKSGTFSLAPGQTYSRVAKVRVPESAPLCEITYDFEVTKNNQPYETSFFIVLIGA